MKTNRPIFFLIILLLPAAAAYADEDISLPEYSISYDPERDPYIDGSSALRYAHQTNRRVLIELGGNWCAYCLELDHFIESNARVREKLHEDYVLLKINVSDENLNEEFLAGLPETDGYPHIFVADDDGSILHSQDTARLRVNGEYSPRRFLQFFDRWAPRQDATVSR